MILLFVVEILIAIYIHDNFIRPYLGDVLVVILIYCFVKTFFKISTKTAVLIVLIFSFSIEFSQYLNIIEKLQLKDIKLARMVLGTSFSWIDLLCYTVGCIIVVVVEKTFIANKIFLK